MLTTINTDTEGLKKDHGEKLTHEEIKKGIYKTFVYDFEKYVTNKLDRNPDLNGKKAYGMCDNVGQVINLYPEINHPDKKYYIQLTNIEKADITKEKEFKWTSWGGYIGDRELKEEYFSLEPDMESVIAYHIIEIV